MANIARLKELLKNVVPFIPDGRLKMEYWTTTNGNANALPAGACGTSACLAGWSASHPKFKRAGLYMVMRDGELGPVFACYDEFNAIEKFFGITREDAMHIFGNHNSNDPVEAAQRIIDVIEANS